MWTLTYCVEGHRRVEFIPDRLASQLAPLFEQGRAYRDALHEILTLNAQLISLWRQQQKEQKGYEPANRKRTPKKKGLSKADSKRTTDR